MNDRAEQDLAMIRRLMEEGSRIVVDRGVHFMIWGIVSALGLAATYTKVVAGVGPDSRLTWMVLLAAGWVGSLTLGWRSGRGARVTTLARRLLAATWMSAGLSLTLVALGAMFGPLVQQAALPGLLSVVIGAPLLATSLLTGQRWLAAVAVGWWVGGAVMLFVPGLYTLVLMAVMAVLLMVVPGAVLNAKARRISGERAAGAP